MWRHRFVVKAVVVVSDEAGVPAARDMCHPSFALVASECPSTVFVVVTVALAQAAGIGAGAAVATLFRHGDK